MKQIKKLKIIVVLAASLLLLLALFAVANAHGHTSDQLKGNWFCFVTGPHDWVHCLNKNPANEPSTIQVKVFDNPDPGNPDVPELIPGHPFLGTEILVHKDIYNGQPCSTDGGGLYHPLFHEPPENGDIPYYACHHFSTQ